MDKSIDKSIQLGCIRNINRNINLIRFINLKSIDTNKLYYISFIFLLLPLLPLYFMYVYYKINKYYSNEYYSSEYYSSEYYSSDS